MPSYDNRTCRVSGSEVKLTARDSEVNIGNMQPDGQWEFKGGKSYSKLYHYNINSFSNVIFEMYFRRRPRFFVLNIIVPCFLMTFLSSLVFFIPAQAGEKISYGISVLLAFVVFMLMFAESLPHTSEYVPLIGNFSIVFFSGLYGKNPDVIFDLKINGVQ